MNGVATEWEQHYSWCSAVIINSCLMRPDRDATTKTAVLTKTLSRSFSHKLKPHYRQAHRHRESPLSEGYGEAGGYVSENIFQKSL